MKVHELHLASPAGKSILLFPDGHREHPLRYGSAAVSYSADHA